MIKASIEFSRIKHLGCVFTSILAIGVLLTGCQGTMFSTTYKGQTIKPSAQIKLVKTGPQSGQFSDGYVTVNYKYTAAAGNLQMSGVVHFDTPLIANFLVVQTFDLQLLVGDAQGKVLMQQGLTTAGEIDVSSSVNFKTPVVLPPQAATMAFSYSATAYGSGGENPTSFWLDPLEE